MDQDSAQICKLLSHTQPLQKQHPGLCWYNRCFQTVRLWAFALPEAGSRTGLWILILHFRIMKGFCMLTHCEDKSPWLFCNKHVKNVCSHFSYILLSIIYYNTLSSPLFRESPWIWSLPFRYNSVTKRQMQTISKQGGSHINKTMRYKETIYSFGKRECFLACICIMSSLMKPFPRTCYSNGEKYLDSKQKIHLHTSSNPSCSDPERSPTEFQL